LFQIVGPQEAAEASAEATATEADAADVTPPARSNLEATTLEKDCMDHNDHWYCKQGCTKKIRG
jgi:hypothetical protein